MSPVVSTEDVRHAPAGPRLRAGDPRYFEIVEALEDEAWLLDHDRLMDWVGLWDEEETVYRLPVRVTMPRGAGPGIAGGPGLAEGMYHFDEDWDTLELKARRLALTKSAWAEVPSSRTRRFVTNVRAHERDVEGEYDVSSNLLLIRSRYDDPVLDLLSAERHDVLRRTDGGWTFVSRYIYIDQSTVAMQNFAVFL